MRSLFPTLPPEIATAMLAVNERDAFYNVGWNHVELRAGQHIILHIEPEVHAVTERFRQLDVETRKCRFRNEVV